MKNIFNVLFHKLPEINNILIKKNILSLLIIFLLINNLGYYPISNEIILKTTTYFVVIHLVIQFILKIKRGIITNNKLSLLKNVLSNTGILYIIYKNIYFYSNNLFIFKELFLYFLLYFTTIAILIYFINKINLGGITIRDTISNEEYKVDDDTYYNESRDSQIEPSVNTNITGPSVLSVLEQSESNPVYGLLLGMLLLHISGIMLILIILITVLGKIILSLDYELKWLDKIFSVDRSIKIRSLIKKWFKFVSRLRDLNILFQVLFLLVISGSNFFFYSFFYFNFDEIIKGL